MGRVVLLLNGVKFAVLAIFADEHKIRYNISDCLLAVQLDNGKPPFQVANAPIYNLFVYVAHDLLRLALDARLSRTGWHVKWACTTLKGLAARFHLSRTLRMRFRAIEKYFSSSSMPMNLRPVLMQATPVVPLPIVKSSTASPSLV